MDVNQKENQLHVYSVNETEYIGAINASFDDSDTNIVQIVVVDHSSAMGQAATRLVKEVLPLVMSKVKNWCSSVQLITFGEESVHKYLSNAELGKFDLKSGGAAVMGPAIEKLRLYFERWSKNTSHSFDVLTISAGEVSDHENAERESKKLTDFLATIDGWRINSQAVRLFTTSSDHQPDTKALSYLLQINNTTEVNVCDVNVTSSNETIANEIAALFPENPGLCLCVENPIILKFPWKSLQWTRIVMTRGSNLFWLNQLPATDVIKLQGKPIDVVVEDQLTLEKFQHMMDQKLPRIVSYMKLLKIVGTTEANETVGQIFSYFAKTEDALAVQCSNPNNKIVTDALAEIAMFKPDFRDSAEMIEFYRNPTKAIEAQIERQRLKIEEEDRCQQEEKERRKQEVEDRVRREEEDRVRREEEDRVRRQEEDRVRREEEDRVRREEEDRCWYQEQEDRRKQEDEDHFMRLEHNRVRLEAKTTTTPTTIQTVFILDEKSSDENECRRFMNKITALMLSKHFFESLRIVHQVTFVRYTSTAAEMLQSLVQALDKTKQIRISILTNGDVHEMESFAKMVMEFLNGSGHSFELRMVRLASTTSLTQKQYKVVDINADGSNEFVAEQIIRQCRFNGQSDDKLSKAKSAGVASNWFYFLIIFLIFYNFYFYFC